jgi:hypothetical protein
MREMRHVMMLSEHYLQVCKVSIEGSAQMDFYTCPCGLTVPRVMYDEKDPDTLYEIHAFCNNCSETHRIDAGPWLALKSRGERVSVGDAFSGRELPIDVQMLNNMLTCPKTGNHYQQKDNKQVFLVRIEMPDYMKRKYKVA